MTDGGTSSIPVHLFKIRFSNEFSSVNTTRSCAAYNRDTGRCTPEGGVVVGRGVERSERRATAAAAPPLSGGAPIGAGCGVDGGGGVAGGTVTGDEAGAGDAGC